MEENVFRLDVAVDDAVAVGVVERTRYFDSDPYRVVHRQLLLPADPVADRLALDVRHHVEEETVRFPAVEEREDMRMLQIGSSGDLGKEPLGADDRGQFGPQHLDRHAAVVPDVLRQVDGGHAALPELPL